jgi:hypothetical protein
MKYTNDFSDSVKSVAKQYVQVYHNNNSVREKHKENMRFFDELGKEVAIFKEVANCIETLLWAEDNEQREEYY